MKLIFMKKSIQVLVNMTFEGYDIIYNMAYIKGVNLEIDFLRIIKYILLTLFHII